jgi:nitric-oxide synthase
MPKSLFRPLCLTGAPVDRREAEDFIRLHHREERAAGDPAARVAAVLAEIDETGTYRHTRAELVYGARVAWRNSNRCIGRLYWRSLRIRDRRHIDDADSVARESAEHLRQATNGGRIRPMITVFAPDAPGRRAADLGLCDARLPPYVRPHPAAARLRPPPRGAGARSR